MWNRDSMRMLLERYYEVPVSAGFDKLGFSPNGVTILGLIVTLISAIFISLGMFLVGGIVMLIGSALDLIDGGLARRLGKVSNFGALLDSVIDRFQEALVFFGVLIYFLTGPCDSLMTGFDTCSIGPVLAYSAFIGSVMVSYLRARAEGLGIDCKVGIMTRPERVIAVGIGLILSQWISIVILFVLVIITVLGLYTTIQRLVHSSVMLKKSE
ncbi:MAG: hypothetical protein CL742_03355 [Chloroflexi bacterium]|nr:hypothetical protein [Chloroflexota bacterium]MQG02056.1 CDP-alcohol phosphatidyltransferase family protein [SAR202 cluster bacterium]|tara:strand:- start:6095 stop:6730 length:636 start_codon:yes stop_codon:yes gene_type:complete